jgi:hypothetical protein|nr:MAG TPA: hypothetical protein [Caudoviricetes sp.]
MLFIDYIPSNAPPIISSSPGIGDNIAIPSAIIPAANESQFLPAAVLLDL